VDITAFLNGIEGIKRNLPDGGGPRDLFEESLIPFRYTSDPLEYSRLQYQRRLSLIDAVNRADEFLEYSDTE
jgi:hypothetical protein